MADHPNADGARPLLVMSWNCAGWEATMRYIQTHYKTLDNFLTRLGCDILAVQEMKCQRNKVQADPALYGAYPTSGGFESFWAFPVADGAAARGQSNGKAPKLRGFNGVTTFARKGLCVAADASPLSDPALDGEGRCLLTDFGGFVMLNVYAHATTGDDGEYQVKLGRKLAFLAAIRAKMDALRAEGRRVVLVGDLNIAARGADVPWRQALCPITPLRLVDQDGVGGTAPSAAVSVAVDDLHKAIGSAENRIALAGMLPSERTHFGRLHKLVLEIIEGGAAPASQGGREDRGDDALGEGEEDEEEEGPSGDVPPAGSQQEQSGEESAAARAGAALRSLAHLIGISNSQRDCVAWFGSLLNDDGPMVDTFAAIRPEHRARFTCWNQFKNQRYTNCGKRIDYILIDRALFQHVLAGPPLVEDETELGALRAATAGGRWLPAPTHGVLSGLQEAKQTTHDSQFVPPHTGIVYTAPQASDHVAVTLLISRDVLSGSGTVSASAGRPADAATKACTFRPQASLKAFFAPKPSVKRPASDDHAGEGEPSSKKCAS